MASRSGPPLSAFRISEEAVELFQSSIATLLCYHRTPTPCPACTKQARRLSRILAKALVLASGLPTIEANERVYRTPHEAIGNAVFYVKREAKRCRYRYPIRVNRARCRRCGTELQSLSEHEDWKTCQCGAIRIRGGQRVLERAGELSLVEELSE
jgi:hypothetical protein